MNDKKKTKKIYYQEAIATVERNINKIYIDSVIDIVMTDIRLRLKIDDKMYSRLKEESGEIDKIDDLHELIKYLIDEWIKSAFKSELEKKIFTKHIAKERITNERAKTEVTETVINQIADSSSDDIPDELLKIEIKEYPLSDSYIGLPTRINLKIWKSIVDAKLFNVPPEKVLDCKKSILEKDYLPSVDMSNGNLYININELTTQGDLSLINDKIETLKQEYKNKYRHENAERSCKDDKLDRLMLELNNQGKKPKEISAILKIDYEIFHDADKISERLKEIRKRSRNNLRKELLFQLGE